MSHSRRVGRVHVFEIIADGLEGEPELPIPDCRMERTDHPNGITELCVTTSSGRSLGTISVCTSAHDDAFYGRYSLPDGDHCYMTRLEGALEARGQGLAKYLYRYSRHVTFQSGRRGPKGLVATNNRASLRSAEGAGFSAHLELAGIRVVNRVIWLRKAYVSP